MAKKAKREETPTVQIEPLRQERILVPIIGLSSLLQSRFTHEAGQAIADGQQGRKKPKVKVARDPEKEFRDAAYRFEDGSYGQPAICFKHAAVGAARFYGGVTMTELKQMIFFFGRPGNDGRQWVPIEFEGDEPIMRRDLVRIGMGQTSLAYRPEFRAWTATLDVSYISSCLDRAGVLSLIDAGGLGGVGEWRPSSKKGNGEFGMYRIDTDKEVQVVQ